MFGVIILFLLPTMVALSGENQANVSETSSANPYIRELLREWCPKAFEEPSKRKSLHPSKTQLEEQEMEEVVYVGSAVLIVACVILLSILLFMIIQSRKERANDKLLQKLQIASNKAAEERQRRIKFDEDVDEEKI